MKSQQAQTFALIVKVIGQIVGSFQIPFRFDISQLAVKVGQNSPRIQSISSHLMPGEVAWHDSLDAQIDVVGSGSNFFGFVMNLGQAKHETTIIDQREYVKSNSNHVAT
jgi:hypothetical protein